MFISQAIETKSGVLPPPFAGGESPSLAMAAPPTQRASSGTEPSRNPASPASVGPSRYGRPRMTARRCKRGAACEPMLGEHRQGLGGAVSGLRAPPTRCCGRRSGDMARGRSLRAGCVCTLESAMPHGRPWSGRAGLRAFCSSVQLRSRRSGLDLLRPSFWPIAWVSGVRSRLLWRRLRLSGSRSGGCLPGLAQVI